MAHVSDRPTLEERLREVGRFLDGVVDAVDDELVPSVRREVDTWHGLLDDVQLQFHLGTMEVRDRLRPVMEALQVRIEEIREQLKDPELGEDAELQAELRHSLAGLRAEIEASPEFR